MRELRQSRDGEACGREYRTVTAAAVTMATTNGRSWVARLGDSSPIGLLFEASRGQNWASASIRGAPFGTLGDTKLGYFSHVSGGFSSKSSGNPKAQWMRGNWRPHSTMSRCPPEGPPRCPSWCRNRNNINRERGASWNHRVRSSEVVDACQR